MNAEIDVRNVLPSVRVPSLIIHRNGDQTLKVEEGRYVASLIPRSRYVELPGDDHLPFVGDQDAILDEIEGFLSNANHSREPERVLATILFLQSDKSSKMRGQIERELQWYRGQPQGDGDDGFVASFDGPARAIKYASAIQDYARRTGTIIRAGLHTGECDKLASGNLGGFAVEIAARVLECAADGEVVVSSPVKDLVAGSGITFEQLNATVEDWRLFRVPSAR